MQSAFGVNAESAIRYTAALEQGNATMLTRYIPTLRDIEDESERVAEAQRVLANAFQVSEAEAQGSRGQIIQLKNAVGDMLEVIGEVIAEAIKPLVSWLKDMAETLQETDRETIALGVAIAGLVAGIGPALFIIGKLTAAIAFLVSPVGLVIAALAALAAAVLFVWDNWQAITERISDISWWRNAVIDMIQFLNDWNPFSLLIDGYNALVDRIGGTPIPNPFDLVNEGLDELRVETKEYEHEFGSFGDAIESAMNRAKQAISGLFVGTGMQEFAQRSESVMDHVGGVYETTADRIERAIGRMMVVTDHAGQKMPEVFSGIADITDELAAKINTAMVDMTESFFTGLSNMAFAGEGLSGVARGLLSTMADLAVRAGRIILAAGLGIEALKKSLSAFTGVGAIAAGAALIAIGSAAKAALSSAGRGASGGGGTAFEPSARSVPQAGGTVTFKIGNNELVGVLQQGNSIDNRIGRIRNV